MATVEEIERAYRTAKKNGAKNITLLTVLVIIHQIFQTLI